MDGLWKDLRQALRSLLRAPLFTSVALVTLTLGIGANTAIFTVASSVLFEPLALREPDRILWVAESNPEAGYPLFTLSPPNFKDFRDQSRVFEAIAASRGEVFVLTGLDEPRRLFGTRVSASHFRVLGADPALGRGFLPDEDQPGGDKVTVVSHALWESQLGSPADLEGVTLTLNGESYTVIGVAPRDLPPPFDTPDLWVPLAMDFDAAPRDFHVLFALARLAPGVSLEAARTELETVAARLRAAYPETNAGWTVALDPLRERLVAHVRPTLLVLLLSVGLVLLIACANLANLWLARLSGRGQELAVRAALGAGRWPLMRRILAESLLVALAGSVLGLLLAIWATRALVALSAGRLPRTGDITVDGGVVVFALALALVTGCLVALLPSLEAARAAPQDALRAGARGQFGGRGGRFVRTGLVFLQVALALVLLISSGLLIRSFTTLQKVDLGFAVEDRLAVEISLPRQRYPDDASRRIFYRQLFERLDSLPGAVEAGTIFPMPLSGRRYFLELFFEGRPVPPPNEVPGAGVRFVSAGFFDALGVPLRRGRPLNEQDTPDAVPVAVVNETAARQFWKSGEDPIGQRISFINPAEAEAEWLTVVGIVGDVRHEGGARPAGPEVYRSDPGGPRGQTTLVVHAAGEPADLAGPLRGLVAELAPGLPIYGVRTVQETVDGSVARPRFDTLILACLAALALILASVGIYGVVSFSVSQRWREIGLRMALGARRGDVARLVVRSGMVPVVAGAGTGLAGAFAATRLLESLLHGVGTTDAATFAGAPLVLAAVALLACLVPAWRASRLDPAMTLRDE